MESSKKPDQGGNIIHTLMVGNKYYWLMKGKVLMVCESDGSTEEQITVGKEEIKDIY